MKRREEEEASKVGKTPKMTPEGLRDSPVHNTLTRRNLYVEAKAVGLVDRLVPFDHATISLPGKTVSFAEGTEEEVIEILDFVTQRKHLARERAKDRSCEQVSLNLEPGDPTGSSGDH